MGEKVKREALDVADFVDHDPKRCLQRIFHGATHLPESEHSRRMRLNGLCKCPFSQRQNKREVIIRMKRSIIGLGLANLVLAALLWFQFAMSSAAVTKAESA